MLAGEIEDQADWRERCAARYPSDPRNKASADALTGLAAWVSSLPDSDPLLGQFTEGEITDGWLHDGGREYQEGGLVIDPESPRGLLSRYGFDEPPGDPREFLAALAAAVRDAVAEAGE